MTATTEEKQKKPRKKSAKPAESSTSAVHDPRQLTVDDRVAAVDKPFAFRVVPLSQVEPSGLNPRRTFNEATIADLAADIRERGLLHPILVRQLSPERFEVIAGERRRRALLLLGSPTAEVMLREDDDTQAREVALVENLQREDVHAMEEAEALGALRDLGLPPTELAGRIAKSASYVHGRLRLLDLCEEARAFFRAGGLLFVSATTLARLPAEDQRTLVERYSKDRADEELEPIAHWQVRNDVARACRNLAQAPWALDVVVEGVAAPACSSCPKRTGAQTALFADGLEANDQCTDGACFAAKLEATTAALVAKHRKRKGAVLDAEESAKILMPWGLPWDCGFVDLDRTAQSNGYGPVVEIEGERPTWREVLTRANPRWSEKAATLAVDTEGAPRWLVTRDVALAALSKVLPSAVDEGEDDEEDLGAPEREEAARQHAIRQRVDELRRAHREAVIEQSTDLQQLARALAAASLGFFFEDLYPGSELAGLLEAHGVELPDEDGDDAERALVACAQTAIATMDAVALVRFALRYHCSSHLLPDHGEAFDSIVGFDESAARATAERELVPEK